MSQVALGDATLGSQIHSFLLFFKQGSVQLRPNDLNIMFLLFITVFEVTLSLLRMYKHAIFLPLAGRKPT